MKQSLSTQLRHSWDTVETQLRYSWDTVKIQLRYSWDTVETQLRHSWDTVKIQLRYRWYTVETQLRYSWDTVETQLRHSWDTVEIQLRHSWDTMTKFAGYMDVHACFVYVTNCLAQLRNRSTVRHIRTFNLFNLSKTFKGSAWAVIFSYLWSITTWLKEDCFTDYKYLFVKRTAWTILLQQSMKRWCWSMYTDYKIKHRCIVSIFIWESISFDLMIFLFESM